MGGASFRAIASLELFALLLAVKFLYRSDAADAAVFTIAGETDNRGNSYIVQKLSCTKFPLICVLREIAWELRWKGKHLEVKWIPSAAEHRSRFTLQHGCEGFLPGQRGSNQLGGS